MIKFKICGLRDVENVLVAANAGAHYLGFVFVPGARRRLSAAQAQEIIAAYRWQRGRGGPKLVGLFANQPISEMNTIVQSCGLDYAQLCGDESPEYLEQVSAQIIKQVRVGDDGSIESTVDSVMAKVDGITSRGHIPLLDKYESGALGGTGRSFDWRIAREVADRYDIVLAGGLSPDNVGEAIGTVRPWGVDVSSGVESDGVKNPEKIKAFAKQVRRAR